MPEKINFKETQKQLLYEIQNRHRRELDNAFELITKELGFYEKIKKDRGKYKVDLVAGFMEEIKIPKKEEGKKE